MGRIMTKPTKREIEIANKINLCAHCNIMYQDKIAQELADYRIEIANHVRDSGWGDPEAVKAIETYGGDNDRD